MTVAVVVVCPPGIRDSALEWGHAGLVADSFWVSSVDVDQLDQDHPNSLAAQRVLPGGVRDPAPLASSLAALGSLKEVRVAWVRKADHDIAEPLRSLEALLRGILPPDEMQWLDIVVPTRRTDKTVASLPSQWVQLRVVPEDRSAPDVTDAGWDLNLDVPLHAALVSAGILGGKYAKLPWAQADADRHYEVRAFSRVVLGALNVDAEARRFIASTMPAASAGTFHKAYLELEAEDAVGLVNSALEFMLGLESDALSYRDPAPSAFTPPPRLSLWEHVKIVFSFLGYCLPMLFGIRPRSRASLYSRFDFKDLGHKVGERKPVVLPGLRPTDFDELDDEAAAAARTALDEYEETLRRNPPVPPASAWRALARLATSINDGGIGPDGWNPPERHKRKPVVGAAWVQAGAASQVSTTVPELATARSAAVASSASRDARRDRHPPLAALTDAGPAVQTAKDIANEGNERDAARLTEQLVEVDPPAEREPVNFMDRLAGRVIGAGLRARLDAERWKEFATSPSPRDPLDWNAAQRKFRLRTLIGVGATLLLAGIWGAVAYFLRTHLPAWLSMPVGFVVVGVVGACYVLWCLYSFFQVYSAYMERGRRKLEIRAIWMSRACEALAESARLAPLRRILAKWIDVLAAIYPHDESAGTRPVRTMPSRAPRCMTVGVPVYTDDEMTAWLAAEGAKRGWRMRALEAMAASAFGVSEADAVTKLVDDNALPGGPLLEFWEQRDALWLAYADDLRARSTLDIAKLMMDGQSRGVSVIAPPAGRPTDTPLDAFRREPWPNLADDDVDPLNRWRDFPVRASRAGSDHRVDLNPDSSMVAVRLQLRRIHGVPRGDDDTPDEDDDDDVY